MAARSRHCWCSAVLFIYTEEFYVDKNKSKSVLSVFFPHRLVFGQPVSIVSSSHVVYLGHMQWFAADAFLHVCYWPITVRFIGSATVPEMQFTKLETGLSQSPCLSPCLQIFSYSAFVALNSLSSVPYQKASIKAPSKEKRKYHRLNSSQLHFHRWVSPALWH